MVLLTIHSGTFFRSYSSFHALENIYSFFFCLFWKACLTIIIFHKRFFSCNKTNRYLILFIDYHVSTARQCTKQDLQTETECLHKKFEKQVKKDYTESKKHLFIHSEGVRLRIQCFNLYFNSGFWTFSTVIDWDLFSAITSHSPRTT